jgi:transposase
LDNVVMAKDFRYPQRDQGFLLPPDMSEWLAADHLVWLTIRVVQGLDLSAFQVRAKLGGRGRAPIDPAMLLTLLVYAYAHGERSSRQIERLCHTDVAFRVICGNEPPDHTVIARFRAAHDEAFIALFDQVLAVCVKAGLGRFATIAIDGTKIAANASTAANRSEDKLRSELRRIVDEAAATDAAEDELFGPDRRGDELPAELVDPSTRDARIAAAIAEVEAEQAAEVADNQQRSRVAHWERRVAASQAVYDREFARASVTWQRRNRRQSGRNAAVPPQQHTAVRRAARNLATVTGNRDAALARAARAPQRTRSKYANTTDPQSRLMRTRKGFVQGYNTQLAVTDDHLIAAVKVTNDVVDTGQLVPMMDQVQDTMRRLRRATGRAGMRVGTVLADGGYASEANLTAAGPPRLIPVKTKPSSAGSDPPGTASEKMRQRMLTPKAKKRYRRRAALVEPVNGHLKDRIGLRQFSRRGLIAVNAEAHLAAASLNLLKLYRATPA